MGYQFLKSVLFKLDPERAHRLTLFMLKHFYKPFIAKQFLNSFPNKPVKLWNLDFPNPVGLAAGFDKNGECIDALLGLGFGFVEVGAVTPRPQIGQQKPRLFRFTSKQAVLNRMGFNNHGLDALVTHLKSKRHIRGIVGVNIGKNASTPLEEAASDYGCCLRQVYPYADYVSVNISSPNTVSLRALQSVQYLPKLLGMLKETQGQLIQVHKRYVPLLLKISPDLTQNELERLASASIDFQMDGLIATNTTTQESVKQLLGTSEPGGVSGKPLFPLTVQVISRLNSLLQGRIPVIAVGGIFSANDAQVFFQEGAQLVQIYSGLIFKGPQLIKQIIKTL